MRQAFIDAGWKPAPRVGGLPTGRYWLFKDGVRVFICDPGLQGGDKVVMLFRKPYSSGEIRRVREWHELMELAGELTT
jgi:hypothetical protein